MLTTLVLGGFWLLCMSLIWGEYQFHKGMARGVEIGKTIATIQLMEPEELMEILREGREIAELEDLHEL